MLNTNTVRVLDGRGADKLPAFREGSVLTAMNALGSLRSFDLASETIVWAVKKQQNGVRDPEVQDNGNVLVFDNGRGTGRSLVVALDPRSGEPREEYRGPELSPLLL